MNSRTAWTFILLAVMGSTAPMFAKDSKLATYPEKIEDEVSKMGRRVENLKSNAQKTGAENRKDIDQQIRSLEEGLRAARKKLDEWKNSTSGQRESLRKGLDSAFRDLKEAYQRIQRHFGSETPPKEGHP